MRPPPPARQSSPAGWPPAPFGQQPLQVLPVGAPCQLPVVALAPQLVAEHLGHEARCQPVPNAPLQALLGMALAWPGHLPCQMLQPLRGLLQRGSRLWPCSQTQPDECCAMCSCSSLWDSVFGFCCRSPASNSCWGRRLHPGGLGQPLHERLVALLRVLAPQRVQRCVGCPPRRPRPPGRPVPARPRAAAPPPSRTPGGVFPAPAAAGGGTAWHGPGGDLLRADPGNWRRGRPSSPAQGKTPHGLEAQQVAPQQPPAGDLRGPPAGALGELPAEVLDQSVAPGFLPPRVKPCADPRGPGRCLPCGCWRWPSAREPKSVDRGAQSKRQPPSRTIPTKTRWVSQRTPGGQGETIPLPQAHRPRSRCGGAWKAAGCEHGLCPCVSATSRPAP